MHTPFTRMPAHGCVPPVGVVVVVVVVLDVVVLDVVVEEEVVDVAARVVVVTGRVVVVVAVAVVVVTLVDVVVEFGGREVTPPRFDGTHSARSGVNRRDRFARVTSKQTNTGAALTAAGATVGGAGVAGTQSRLGSRILSWNRSPACTGNGGEKRVVAFRG